MNQPKFGIKEAVSFGWQKALANLKLFLLVGLFLFVVTILYGFFDAQLSKQSALLSLLSSLIYDAFSLLSTLALIKLYLALGRGEKPDFSSFVNSYRPLLGEWRMVLNYTLASFLYGLIVLIGFILLIVPGVIFSLKYSQFQYLIVDKKMGPIEALKKSGEMTRGSKGQLFKLGLVFGLIFLAGLIPGVLTLGVGLLVVFTMRELASVFVYQKLSAPPSPAADSLSAPPVI